MGELDIMKIFHVFLTTIIAVGVTAFAFSAQAEVLSGPQVVKVAESAYQWTGVAVSPGGRVFVKYPTWNDHPDFKVAELVRDKAVPFPSQADNKKFICVQSVVADAKDHLWILDPAKLRGQAVDPSGAKLFQVSLKDNTINRTYIFPKTVALDQSYMNDVRIDRQGTYAYLTDSGVGGIIVLDLQSGQSWRALSDIPEVKANLKSIDFVTTGPMTRLSQSDGIELSPDDKLLYFTALGGDRLHAVPTWILRDRNMSVANRQAFIDTVNMHNVPTDGMILRQGRLYMADLPVEGLWEFDVTTRQGRVLPVGQALRWADSFANAPDGSIYFTTSQINYPMEKRQTYKLYRLIL